MTDQQHRRRGRDRPTTQEERQGQTNNTGEEAVTDQQHRRRDRDRPPAQEERQGQATSTGGEKKLFDLTRVVV